MKRIIMILTVGIIAMADATAQNSAVLEKMDKILSQLSDSHKYIFFEDFNSTGIGSIAASELKMDYSSSAADKAMYEKELNHYLSQLGTSYISLPQAGEYVSEDVDLMGMFVVNCRFPEIGIKEYAGSISTPLRPFQEGKTTGMSTEKLNLFDFAAALQEIAKVQDVEGEKYEWILAKNGFNHRFTLEDKGNGFTITLLGINQLDEYSSGPAAPQGTGVVAAEVSNLSAAEKLQQTAGTSLPDSYTIWIKTSTNWYIAVKEEKQGVFLKLALKANGDMNYMQGSGFYVKPQGGGYAKYTYTNGKWGAGASVNASEIGGVLQGGENDYIIVPGENMSKDRVKLFEKNAYFDDLDISLP